MSELGVGHRLEMGLVSIVEEKPRFFDAGPLKLVVESRLLTDEIVTSAYKGDEKAAAVIREFGIERFADAGPSIHVFDAATSTEVLRFDMFEHQPHYHYIHSAEEHTVVLFDYHADPDVMEWSLQRLSNQVPSMLRFAGFEELAATVDQTAMDAAVVEVRACLGELGTQADDSRMSA